MTPPNPPEQELLACPWGHKDVVVVKHIASEGWSLECAECGCEGPRAPTEAKAIAAWNRRTPTPSLSEEARFFIDHGMIHDRLTGKHVTTEPDEDTWNGGTISDCLALLNSLAASRSTDLAKVVEALNRCAAYFRNSHTSDSYGARQLSEMTELCEAALASIRGEAE